MNQRTIHPKFLVIVNIAAYVVVLTVNFLSNALPLNGRTAEEVSAALPSYFTPAGYTFAIWGLIYTALLGFVVYQALPAQRQRPIVGRVGILFAASSLLNAGWLFTWHYGYFTLSVVVMLALLATLILLYLRLGIGRSNPSLTLGDRLFLHFPFSLYLGWITVATIANVASVAAHLGWDGFGLDPRLWSAVMMFVAVIVAGVLLSGRRNLAYAGVLVWALFGIRAAYPAEALIANSALIAAGLIFLLALAGYARLRAGRATLQMAG